MERFKDRWQAGERLAEELRDYQALPGAVVLGLARGGVVTAAAVAKRLRLPLDVICPRKISAPNN
ncbi:MAG: phosphoribosyl transferase, partial [Chlamydiia bacterium]|nr:phosphoribosyl transferase [Chlamydiia bacterium]